MFETEAEDLFNKIHEKYGYDFRGYSRASAYRRIKRFISNNRMPDVDSLKEYIFSNSVQFEYFLQEFTVNVTEMFRDPSFYLSLRRKIIPLLSTYPYIKIWDAGCSSGEELFSLAILLQEENLLDRTKIYATDINQKVLKEAKEGIFPLADISQYTKNYHEAGGRAEFSNYYIANYGKVKFDSSLIKNVVFYPHNLATDNSFNEFHLIVCRNVIIYFNNELQERVFKLFDSSIISLGYLCLGKKETLSLSSVYPRYEIIDKENKMYKRKD